MSTIRARPFWLNKIRAAWARRSIIWLSGVRRVGKTCLCQSIQDLEYFDCELPRIRKTLSDPEDFLRSITPRAVVLDEVHRLEEPAQLLKIAADHFPKVKIIATGSSTLGASAKFKDTLTGRKSEIWLTPMVLQDMQDFGHHDLKRRLLHGGLPPFFLSEPLPEADFQEWMDAYWAKDVQELFRVEKRQSFQKLFELLMAQSGGIFEATRFAGPCEISRTAIINYLSVLEETYVVHVLRPFNSRRANEILAAPKVYGMDSGFVAYHRNWHTLRHEDLGHLWEHVVLNELQACLQTRRIQYWRDKHGHEVDFVLARRQSHPIAIEAKWSNADFDPQNLLSFRHHYPRGLNLVVSQDCVIPITRHYDNIAVTFLSLPDLTRKLTQSTT